MDKLSNIFYEGALKLHPQLGAFYKSGYQLINFMIVGTMGALTQCLFFNLFRSLNIIEFIAFVCSILISFLQNYMLNKLWVFKVKVKEKKKKKGREK